MANGAGKPKPAFFIAVLAVVLGPRRARVLSLQREEDRATAAGGRRSQFIDPTQGRRSRSGSAADRREPRSATRRHDGQGVQVRAGARALPEVKGTSDYKPLGKPRVVKFAINVWAGWAPIICANNGFKPGKVWKDAKGGKTSRSSSC